MAKLTRWAKLLFELGCVTRLQKSRASKLCRALFKVWPCLLAPSTTCHRAFWGAAEKGMGGPPAVAVGGAPSGARGER